MYFDCVNIAPVSLRFPMRRSWHEAPPREPADAYYESGGFKLAIEYWERQQSEIVSFCDKKQTCRQCRRGERRRRYDDRRRELLPKHGIVLVKLSYDLCVHGGKRLERNAVSNERTKSARSCRESRGQGERG